MCIASKTSFVVVSTHVRNCGSTSESGLAERSSAGVMPVTSDTKGKKSSYAISNGNTDSQTFPWYVSGCMYQTRK